MLSAKKPAVYISLVLFLVIAGRSLYVFLNEGYVSGSSLLFSFIALSYLLNSLTWGDFLGKEQKDELDQHIESQSAKIGYYVLMMLSGIVLFVSEGVGDLNQITNYPLLIVVGLTFVVQPLTALVYARKYR
ncbi:hypothetical protein KP77_34370 [Jeotgalibacillus alimentarius]|uniref:Uncharacterized protein n=1 Tax=Jeotgalibacillus alimentarius TaxID=135826 RepID=A0A0C2V166_9BACL|nr:hypothetical protein [Jeotgalibacillus alimentarius]KIL42807.1 hypothetical protein KP77_34370 [Jeotgalibacillus alimentarius]